MSKTVRDPIHDMIELQPHEWAAANTPAMQRLRRIQQLAMTHLVYPGTRHDRFGHSIGVCHVAGRLTDALIERTEMDAAEQNVIRLAALTHDVGHGPFSHVSEEVMERRTDGKKIHEAVSVGILRTNDELRAAAGADECDAAAELIENGAVGNRSAAVDIVSGPTDADKLDYLLRDSHFAGVNYGRYDLGRIIDTACVIGSGSPESFLGFDEDGLWAVEELLLARHHMHRQVYGASRHRHHADASP